MKIVIIACLSALLAFSACATETFLIEDSTWRTCSTRCGHRKLKHLGYRVTYSYVYFQSNVQDIICECFDNYRYMMGPKGSHNNDEYLED